MKKNLLANLAGEQQGGSKARRSNVDLQKRKRGGRADASSSQRSNSSKADASVSISKCKRCQRRHKGGAADCWQTKLPDGTPIASKPTATNPFKSNNGASKCQHCGSDRHTSATCYVKNGKRRDSDSGRRQQTKAIKRRKLANGLPAKQTRFAASNGHDDSGDEADRASSSEGSERSYYSPTSQ
jgi:hypothetical protein